MFRLPATLLKFPVFTILFDSGIVVDVYVVATVVVAVAVDMDVVDADACVDNAVGVSFSWLCW